jgi:pimeloyl-ACP methyl ester carboxylesterase
MPHPIIGVGHSVGASQLTHLSHLHPRLLHSLVLVDPIIQLDLKVHKTLAKLSTSRRDIWPSRKAAAESFRNSKFYKAWDPRVLEKWLQFGLRDLPTEQYPEAPDGLNEGDDGPPVTLSTTVAQEVYFYVRASYRDERLLQDDDLLQEIHPEDRDASQLSRPESQKLFRLLPEVKPSVLYVFGGKSDASPPESRLAKIETTGTGVGGSGGAEVGKVKEVVLDCGHLVGMERPAECAEATACFIEAELGRWEAQERARDEALEGLGRRERVGINERWRGMVGAKGKPQGRL